MELDAIIVATSPHIDSRPVLGVVLLPLSQVELSTRITLSFATILGRSGIFELSAYVFVAVATQKVMHQVSPSHWREDCERIRLSRDWNFSRREILVLLIGLRLLVAANYCEASQIVELFR